MTITQETYDRESANALKNIEQQQAIISVNGEAKAESQHPYHMVVNARNEIKESQDKLRVLEYELAASLAEINGQTLVKQSAFVVMIKSRYIDSGNGFTSNWGYQYNQEHPTNVLIVGTKCSLKGYNNSNEVIGQYAHWNERPQMIETTAEKQDFGIFSEERTGHDDGNSRTYSPTMEAFIALKNTTEADIVVPLKMLGTSYTNYASMAINAFIPDSANNNEVSTATFQNLANYTSNAATTRTANLTIPAGKTAIVHFSSAFRYHDGASGFYNYIGQLQIMNLESMFPTGIELDKQVMKNLDINRGYQITSAVDGGIDAIWTATEPTT